MEKRWSEGKIVAVILASMGAFTILVGSFYISVIWLVRSMSIMAAEDPQEEVVSEAEIQEDLFSFLEEEEEDPDLEDPENDPLQDELSDPKQGQYGKEYKGSQEYYEFHDDIRTDLSYSVKFATYRYVSPENSNLTAEIIYPVVRGQERTDLDEINRIVKEELEAVEKYIDSLAEQMSEHDEFEFTGTAYVTYMAEDILSIAYVEESYYNDDPFEACIVSVNIDMETGMAMKNSQILDIDDDFSIEFRERCDEQNGGIDDLYYFSDQEITEYLNDEDNLIIFYTPLGMEVGFNYYYGWVTVTYHDYLDFQKKL